MKIFQNKEYIFKVFWTSEINEEMKSQYVQLHNEIFKSNLDSKAFQTKFVRNIYGDSIHVIVYKNDIPCAIRSLWRNDCNDTVCFQPCDTGVLSTARGEGIFAKMTKYAIDYITFDKYDIYNFPNENSRRLYLKNGWRISSVSYVKLFISNRIYQAHSDRIIPDEYAKWYLLDNNPQLFIKRIKNAYYVNFRADVFGHIEYWQIKFILTATDPVQIVAGFHSVDEETRKQKKDKDALEKALQMANSASRAKTTFLNNMSHDIRTPMNAIIGFTGLAANHINNKEQVTDYLSKIKQSSEHLLSLINDVLDMSRIESGKMNITNRPENLADIIHTLRGLVLADVRSREQTLLINLDDVHDEMIMCDKLRLNQVLLNVVSNAIKYTLRNGSILMNIAEKPAEPGYAIYEFRVKDNGIGMSEEFLRQIFDPFTRVNSSTVSGIQGTGLGMSITKNIVDMMGGTIKISSVENVGTEVLLEFKFEVLPKPAELTEVANAKGMRVLVVDDKEDVCKSVARLLEKEEMRADWCLSGVEAIPYIASAIANHDEYSLFVFDWNMPEMNGVQLSREVRKIVGPDVPIAILTSYDWVEIEKEAIEAGVTSFFAKPLFPSDLHRILLKLFGSASENAAASGLPTQKQAYDFTGRRVMLVEDNELNREISTEILEDLGIEVVSMESGTLAVEKLKYSSMKLDLILMDIQMPGIDGYEATRRIRAMTDKDVSKIPIIAMTANAFEEDKLAAIEAGMNGHVAKPVDVDVLCAMLAKYFN